MTFLEAVRRIAEGEASPESIALWEKYVAALKARPELRIPEPTPEEWEMIKEEIKASMEQTGHLH